MFEGPHKDAPVSSVYCEWLTSGQSTEEVTSEPALFGLSQCHHSNDPNIPKNLNL